MTVDSPRWTIFKAGGLLYADDGEHNRVFVLGDDVTIDHIPPVVDEDIDEFPRTELAFDLTPIFEYNRFVSMWRWEWCTKNRNRWQELVDRGGQVDRRWTDIEWRRCDGTWSPQPASDGIYDAGKATVEERSATTTLPPAPPPQLAPTVTTPATLPRRDGALSPTASSLAPQAANPTIAAGKIAGPVSTAAVLASAESLLPVEFLLTENSSLAAGPSQTVIVDQSAADSTVESLTPYAVPLEKDVANGHDDRITTLGTPHKRPAEGGRPVADDGPCPISHPGTDTPLTRLTPPSA